MKTTPTFRPYRRFFFPEAALAGEQLDAFLANGWYRMRNMVFTQSHYHGEPSPLDSPVWWLRFPIPSIGEHASHRKLRRRNRRFKVSVLDPFVNRLAFDSLYERYFESIDFEGYPSIEDAVYEDPFGEPVFRTGAIALYDEKRPVAMGLFDLGANACASILHFYHPDYARFSLGRYLVLLTVDLLRERGYEWYYPGYVVPGRPKFDYKLFLGKECAEYYDPGEERWKPFEEGILDTERNPPNTELEYEKVFYDGDFPPPFL